MTRHQAVQRLFTFWGVAAFVLTGLMALQTIGGKYDSDYPTAWSWLLAIVVPILSILCAAAFVDPNAKWRDAKANSFKYRSALFGSMVVVGSALVTLFAEPLVQMSPFELFGITGIPLSLLQGLVLAAVGSVVFDRR